MKKINKPTDDAVVISCQLIDQIRKQGGKNWADLLSLYVLYYYSARRQHTNRPWATNLFVKKGFHWGEGKVKDRKAKLVSLGLIENFKIKRKNKRFGKSVVQVNYVWRQSHTEETPENKTTTSIFPDQVATDQQMLKVVKNKCLNLIQKAERRKGDSTIPENLNNTNAEIQTSSSLADTVASSIVGVISCTSEVPEIAKHSGNVQVGEVSSSVTPSSSAKGNKPEVMSRDKYIAVMSKRFNDLCEIDGVHILNADLASNTRRLNWSKQYNYWERRFSDIDIHQTEAWRLIAAYLRVFYSSNSHYPDTRLFFRGWRAIGWQEEKNKILSFCNTHNADPVLRNYVEMRAEEGKIVIAKWLLSSADYSRWFMSCEKDIDAGGSASDAFENRPSGGFKSLQDWEKRHAEGMKKEEEGQRMNPAVDLIERARTLIHSNSKNEQIISEIGQALQLYKDRRDLYGFKQSIEALESSQASREVPAGGKT